MSTDDFESSFEAADDMMKQHAIEGIDTVLNGGNNGEHESRVTEAEHEMKEEELSFYTNSENEHGDDNIWGLLSGVGGNIYEWYDFAVYGLLAPEIGHSFFPDSSKELQLINSFGVYLAAFLMRPIGAILFGELGDRIVGRKNALVFSILLITIPSILMGVLPTYEHWGAVAPICLVLLRMLQGLSVGGQLAGSYVLSIEQSSSKSRGFRGSICDASSIGGFLLASLVTTITRSILSVEQVDLWGWRCPFLFSLILAPILYKIVKNTEESQHFLSAQDEGNNSGEISIEKQSGGSPALVDLLRSPFRRRQLIGMIGVLSATASSFYVIFLFAPIYLSHMRGVVSEQVADLMNVCVVASYIFFLLVSGKLSDTFPHRMDMMRIGLPGIAAACPAMFGLFESESLVGYLLAQLFLAASLAMVQGSLAAWEVELWMSDPTLSFTGVAIGHNVAATIFGGSMPLVATFLFYRANELEASDNNLLWPRLLPGLYVSLLCCVSLYCVSFVVKHPHDVRTGRVALEKQIEVENKRSKRRKKQKKKNLEQIEAGTYTPPTV